MALPRCRRCGTPGKGPRRRQRPAEPEQAQEAEQPQSGAASPSSCKPVPVDERRITGEAMHAKLTIAPAAPPAMLAAAVVNVIRVLIASLKAPVEQRSQLPPDWRAGELGVRRPGHRGQ